MNKKFFWVGFALILLFTFTGCNAKNIKINEEMNGQTISLKQGDTLILSLAGNPTTGYNWEVVDDDQSILAPVGEADYQAGSTLIGAGGTYTFEFKAKNAGTTALKLKYYRSFEKEVPPIDTFEITVEVK